MECKFVIMVIIRISHKVANNFSTCYLQSCVNDHAYGLTRKELEHRRQQRISKNLATAQVGLYDKMNSIKEHLNPSDSQQSNNVGIHQYARLKKEITHPNGVLVSENTNCFTL